MLIILQCNNTQSWFIGGIIAKKRSHSRHVMEGKNEDAMAHSFNKSFCWGE